MPYPEQIEEIVKERKSIIALHSGAESVDEWLRSALTKAFRLGIEASEGCVMSEEDCDNEPESNGAWSCRDKTLKNFALLKGKEPKL